MENIEKVCEDIHKELKEISDLIKANLPAGGTVTSF